MAFKQNTVEDLSQSTGPFLNSKFLLRKKYFHSTFKAYALDLEAIEVTAELIKGFCLFLPLEEVGPPKSMKAYIGISGDILSSCPPMPYVLPLLHFPSSCSL